MTSATDRLRALLDERGVEWTGSDTRTGFIVDGIDWEAYEHVVFGEPSGLLSVMTALTPAQAVEATLGPGTCHETIVNHHWRGCGSCGYIWEFMYGIGKCERPCYCPNCGARVVEP